MKITKGFFFILILFGTTVTFSQNILTSTIQWNCTSTFDAQDGMMTDEITKVVSSPTQITWYDNNNNVKYTLDVTESDGSWTNVANNGSIIFNVSNGDSRGVVQFVKAGGATKVIIHFVLQDGKSIYELKVNNVTSL